MVRNVEDLTAELGRSPRVGEVAARSGLTEEEVLDAMELGQANLAVPLEVRTGDDPLVVELGREDDRFGLLDDHDLLSDLLAGLGDQERLVIDLRYRDGLTQSAIAAHLGMSQMWVSRLLDRTLTRLRARALASENHMPGLRHAHRLR